MPKFVGRACRTAFALTMITSSAHAGELIMVAGIPVDFILFGLTLLCVALFHNHTLYVGLGGLSVITLYKLVFTGFKTGSGLEGLELHLIHEWVTLGNLFLLLMGFVLLSRHFEKSHLPVILPKYLPHDWKGGFVLLVLVFIMSGFLDNIAAAMIGGAMAHQLFNARVHVGYLAAIVAVSNAGGAGSVLGDTTTTMMWIAGVNPVTVLDAYIAVVVALLITGYFGAKQQQAYSPILKHSNAHTRVDKVRIGIVAMILIFAVSTNVLVNMKFSSMADHFPFLGAAVWLTIILSVPLRRPDWEVLPETFKGTIFLLSLVTSASMMPVEKLPIPTAMTTLGLGFLSSVFDNIPLTELALKQGGYDSGILAYAVGFGGSMVWFGSSSGVAISNLFPETKSVITWLRKGWHVPVAYVAGFAVLYATLGWNPDLSKKNHNNTPNATHTSPSPIKKNGEVA